MDSIGEFHEVEIDGKPYLVFHQPKNQIPQIDSQASSSGEAAIDLDFGGDDLPLQPLFLCPRARINILIDQEEASKGGWFTKFNTSPHFPSTQPSQSSPDSIRYNHHVLPLFWCNNKEAKSECSVCDDPSVGTTHYFCVNCDLYYHKECVESPFQMYYPSHHKHPLQLYFCSQVRPTQCILCRKLGSGLVYYCAICDISMHVLCAHATIPFFLDQPKRHDHTLALFPRQASLTCYVCGLLNELHLTYVCPRCDFVSHSDCLHIPNIIRICRHHHRVSFTSSRLLEKKSCGVCRREVDNDYGAYTCNKCSGYVVHVRCALRKDVWDGINLEGVPEDDEDEDVDPFQRIADGIIRYFSHDHHLRLEISRVYDKNKFCQACVLPISEGGFYACMNQCDFLLHETCANAPLKKQHVLYPHPLKLKVAPENEITHCRACARETNGFVYLYHEAQFYFSLDMRCASVSEPFEYQGHKHPLFMSLEPGKKPICHVCKSTNYQKVLNCIECEFVICFKCATLPYTVRYKHDEHCLTFCHGDEASDLDWCELCEGKLAIGGKEGFYKCDDCCTTLHINCLLGSDPYMKPGETIHWGGIYGSIKILHNKSFSRPICIICHRRCQYPTIFSCKKGMLCSLKCIRLS